MSLKEIISLIEKDLEKVEQNIEENLENDVKLITTVSTHILKSGGKRLRPAILLLICKMFDYHGEEKIPLSTAIEFIHTATLLHDDVVDNSALRRGKKTANSIWGNEASVLVGDFLFAKAFILMVECNNLEILKIMSESTGKLAEGEIFELVKTGDLQTSESEYFKIIEKKTAVLFAAAAKIGGILANRNRDEINALENYGLNIGIAFQLVDDALDYSSTNEELGKKIGIDIQEGKVTLPLIKAIEENKNSSVLEEIKEIFYKDTLSDADIEKIKSFVIKNKGVEKTIEIANKYINMAINNLSIFPESKYNEALKNLAQFISKRRF